MSYLVVKNPLSLYENNFDKLVQLIPDIGTVQGSIILAMPGYLALQVNVLEQTPYTTTLQLSQSLGEGIPWLGLVRMKVRVYHDARLAEVIAYQGVHSFLPLYPYPNPQMLQPYEKRRVNQFLGEWLSYCVRQGYQAAIAKD